MSQEHLYQVYIHGPNNLIKKNLKPLLPILGKPAVFHGIVQTIICKSDAFKIDLNIEDNFGKTGISYFRMRDQTELKEYALENNIVQLLDILRTSTYQRDPLPNKET